MIDNFWSLMGVLLTVVVILILAWRTSRWIGSAGMNGQTRMGSVSGIPAVPGGLQEHFRVTGQIMLGRNERLILLKTGETCCLLGVTEHQITLLKEFNGAEAELFSDGVSVPPDFLSILRENFGKFRNPMQNKESVQNGEPGESNESVQKDEPGENNESGKKNESAQNNESGEMNEPGINQ